MSQTIVTIVKAVKGQSSSGKKGGRKIGRNRIKCDRYRLSGRREKNKAGQAAKREKKFAKRREKRKAGKLSD